MKVDAYDCGDGIADWLCKQFDKEPNSYRLCYLGPNLLPRPVVEEPQWGGLFSSKDVVILQLNYDSFRSNSFQTHLRGPLKTCRHTCLCANRPSLT